LQIRLDDLPSSAVTWAIAPGAATGARNHLNVNAVVQVTAHVQFAVLIRNGHYKIEPRITALRKDTSFL